MVTFPFLLQETIRIAGLPLAMVLSVLLLLGTLLIRVATVRLAPLLVVSADLVDLALADLVDLALADRADLVVLVLEVLLNELREAGDDGMANLRKSRHLRGVGRDVSRIARIFSNF